MTLLKRMIGTVLIIEDHALIVSGIKAILGACDKVGDIWSESAPDAALALARRVQPDVITLDLSMPQIHGLDLIAPLQEAAPRARIVVITSINEPQMLRQVVAAAPHGLMQKGAASDFLLAVLSASEDAAPHLCPQTQSILADAPPPVDGPDLRLTKRERDVVTALAKGHTSAQTAADLGISEHTVRKHRENLMRKTGAQSTAHLVRFAMLRGDI